MSIFEFWLVLGVPCRPNCWQPGGQWAISRRNSLYSTWVICENNLLEGKKPREKEEKFDDRKWRNSVCLYEMSARRFPAYFANHVAVGEHVGRHRHRIFRLLAVLQLLVLPPEVVHVRHVEPRRDARDNPVSVRARWTEDCRHTLLQKLASCNTLKRVTSASPRSEQIASCRVRHLGIGCATEATA